MRCGGGSMPGAAVTWRGCPALQSPWRGCPALQSPWRGCPPPATFDRPVSHHAAERATRANLRLAKARKGRPARRQRAMLERALQLPPNFPVSDQEQTVTLGGSFCVDAVSNNMARQARRHMPQAPACHSRVGTRRLKRDFKRCHNCGCREQVARPFAPIARRINPLRFA
jgi:hypothetical protein